MSYCKLQIIVAIGMCICAASAQNVIASETTATNAAKPVTTKENIVSAQGCAVARRARVDATGTKPKIPAQIGPGFVDKSTRPSALAEPVAHHINP